MSGLDDMPPEFLEALSLESPPPCRKRPTFGIGKTFGGQLGMSRAVVMFSRPPGSQPLSLCCNLPGVFIGHKFILDMVKEKLNNLPSSDLYVPSVLSIQFQDRNVKLGTQKMTNRWIITVNCPAARDELLRVGLYILSRKVILKRYDEVLQAEYKEYKDCIAEQKKLFAKLGPNRIDTRVEEIEVENKLHEV